MMDGLNFRWATAEDSEKFALWAVKNKQIPIEDIKRAMKENNPTATVLVVTLNDEPVLFVPLYLTARIAFLGFRPESTAEDRLAAMEMMLLAIKAFAATWSIAEINTLTKSGYPVAQWASAHDFSVEDRELFELRLYEEKKV